MKPVWGLILFAIVFSIAGLVMIFKGQVEVEPLRVLNPTNFRSTDEVGAVVFRRFWAEVNAEKLVVLGSSPGAEPDRDWARGFMAVAKSYKIEFAQVFEAEGVPSLLPNAQDPRLKKLDWEKVQIALAGEGKVLVHLPSTQDMWAQVAHRTIGGIVLFTAVLPVTDTEKVNAANACRANPPVESVSKVKYIGDLRIACVAEKSLSHGKKKKFDQNQITATIEKHGRRENIVFLHVP